jgi:hypothetical protein
LIALAILTDKLGTRVDLGEMITKLITLHGAKLCELQDIHLRAYTTVLVIRMPETPEAAYPFIEANLNP